MKTLAPEITRSTTTVSGITTHIYEVGQANHETLLLLHGMSASADTFRDLMWELSRSYRVIAPDIPGFGFSGDTRPYTFPRLTLWLRDLMDQSEAGPAHFGGHSFGGALAVNYALAQPDDVHSLLLMAPSILRPGKYPHWLRKFAQNKLSEWILELGVSASQVMIQRQMRAAFYDPSRFEESLWERRHKDYKRARASAAVLRASALHDMREDLQQIRQRSCIIWGKHDPVLDPGDAAVLNELMPASRTQLHLLPECGHIPHIEQKEQVVSIFQQFLAAE